ncbi:carboxylate--amine ligase [bacterium SCN 62-11]|nr:ATP-grasp domain-containing protein [Candidatus Eremiobacteraeota bacterium]ODT73885.1 MAG: carboxylate--amine ligase [bacterium SCN 62-11]
MNFVYLCPDFPPNFTLFSRRLAELGVRVLGVGEAPCETFTPALRHALSDYVRVRDMHDYEELVRALGLLTHRHGKLERLDSHAEYWLETEARLRSDFNIPGLRAETIGAMKSKSQMKEIFRRAGLNVAPGRIAHCVEEAEAFFREVGGPVVAKPDIGVGAAGTYKLESLEQLREFYAEGSRHGYFLEQYIQGDLFSFDGLVDRDGRLVFCTAHAFSDGIMEIVNRNDHIFYYSLREIPADLEEAGRRLLAAYDLRERFFHFEFFRTPDGSLVALEVNMRPPGGLTTDLFNYANNIDIYREWANVVVHNHFAASWTRPYHACYVGRKDWKSYRHSSETIRAHFGEKLVHQERIHSLFVRAIGDEGFLLRSPHLDEVLQAAEFILA